MRKKTTAFRTPEVSSQVRYCHLLCDSIQDWLMEHENLKEVDINWTEVQDLMMMKCTDDVDFKNFASSETLCKEIWRFLAYGKFFNDFFQPYTQLMYIAIFISRSITTGRN